MGARAREVIPYLLSKEGNQRAMYDLMQSAVARAANAQEDDDWLLDLADGGGGCDDGGGGCDHR